MDEVVEKLLDEQKAKDKKFKRRCISIIILIIVCWICYMSKNAIEDAIIERRHYVSDVEMDMYYETELEVDYCYNINSIYGTKVGLIRFIDESEHNLLSKILLYNCLYATEETRIEYTEIDNIQMLYWQALATGDKPKEYEGYEKALKQVNEYFNSNDISEYNFYAYINRIDFLRNVDDMELYYSNYGKDEYITIDVLDNYDDYQSCSSYYKNYEVDETYIDCNLKLYEYIEENKEHYIMSLLDQLEN